MNIVFQKLNLDSLISNIREQLNTITVWEKAIIILAFLICIIGLFIVINKVAFGYNNIKSQNVSNKTTKRVKVSKTDYIIYFFILPSVMLVSGLIGLLSWIGLF